MSESVESPEVPKTALPTDLPAVEPPTAGFIVQLFGIPLAIVAVAVLVWLLFGKIAASHRTPQDYLEDLRSTNFERRWSAARDLASILPRNKEWQNDQKFAGDLAGEFVAELGKTGSGTSEVSYLHFIAQALGEFNSPGAIPALRAGLKSDLDRDVREAAVMGLGRLADRLGGLQDSDAIADLVAASRDDDEVIRLKAAWILGRTDNPQAIDGLLPLLNHANHELRYNAAASLARLGNLASLETLAEMLDLDLVRKSLEARGLPAPNVESQLVAIPLSAIQSLAVLIGKAPDTDLSKLRTSIETLARQGSPMVRTRAKDLLAKLGKS